MAIKIDPATGLPELPEGYSFNVSGTYPDYQVALMRETESPVAYTEQWQPRLTTGYRSWDVLHLFGRRTIDKGQFVKVPLRQRGQIMRPIKAEGTEQGILDAATQLVEQLAKIEKFNVRLGDYPPKRIGGTPDGH